MVHSCLDDRELAHALDPMSRIRAVLEYDGTDYHGWQRQPDAPTVQETCERALADVLGGEPAVIGSGRTDAGVHARGQVVHFDHPGRIPTQRLQKAWNARLPGDVWVARLDEAADDFHARYDARRRTYRYHVVTGEHARSPFRRRYAWSLDRAPDWERVERATRALPGTHDFHRFARGVGPAVPGEAIAPGRCTVYEAAWSGTDGEWRFEITADRYLRHMVRSLVGTLVAVGQERLEPAAIEGALAAGGRRPPTAHAPPCGLFLWRVEYGA